MGAEEDGVAFAVRPAKKQKAVKAVKAAAATRTAAQALSTVVASSENTKKKDVVTRKAIDRSWHAAAASRRIIRTKQKISPLQPGQEETRLREHVDAPSEKYRRFLKSANTQRMYILLRDRGVEEACHAGHVDCPCETLQVAGSTGNMYTVEISHLPSCSCPVGIFTKKGQEQCCKHVLYVLHHVLKAPDKLKYQNAFLTEELKELFANAPALPSEVADETQDQDGNRKPVEDDCPICCMDFDAENEEIVWCRAACGNNVHKECFEKWAATKYGDVTCPFCRAVWEYQEVGKKKKQKVNVVGVDLPGETGEGGYRNVRHLLNYD